MKRSLGLLLLLIVIFFITHIVQVQSQQEEFISLDCGRPANKTSPYRLASGLWFSSDEKFIQSGETGRIRENPNGFSEQYVNLRYFPEGTRNCYNLNVEKGQTYFIVTYFVYGNYDGLDIKPVFDIHLGPNPWVTIDLKTDANGIRREILHTATSNTLQICLVKIGTTTPLISALELRPMERQIYITQSGSLSLYFRSYYSNSSSQLRIENSAAIVIAALIIFLVLRMKKTTILEGLHLLVRKSTMNKSFANKNSRRFTYSEVIQMTNNFQRVLGKGGFGMVYHGNVNGSKQVAVKILSQSSTQGYKEFKAEVDLLVRVHHTNLVSLVGYCYERDQLALIYEFLPNGDLKQHLTGKGGKSIINWSTRLQIALEAALGLEYLHIGCTPPMVHRDVKTANILLDENFNAKLADFGLSRSFQCESESTDLTVIAGTPGYLDPEYSNSGLLGEKSDVYSFGIVLLEMITNQPVIGQTSECSHITQWVGFKLNRGDIIEIMDPSLRKYYDFNSAWRALELALSCTNPSSSKRPSMSKVIHELKECIVCENLGISKNGDLQPEEMNVNLDTSVVPMAR